MNVKTKTIYETSDGKGNVDNKGERRMGVMKRLTIGLLSLAAFIWIAGTCFLIWAATFPPTACQWPYRAYAYIWPLYYVMSDNAILWTQKVAFGFCGF